MKRHKIWFGVGAFVVAGTTASGVIGPAADATPADLLRTASPRSIGVPDRAIVLAQHAEHGKPDAGEAGESGDSSGLNTLPAELAFATRIALLRGHLLIGDELVKQQQWTAALPHFLHPTEELYNDLKDSLVDYKIAPFDGVLTKLAEVVKARRSSDYARARDAVTDALSGADAAMRERTGDWPGLVTESAIETLKVAGSEYGAAIVAGKIAKPVEYQDARGFIWQAESMIESVAPQLEKKNPEALASVRTGFAELKKAFPSAMPPRAPVMSPPDLLSNIARIELAAGKLM
jgi:hypothetical protein